MNEWIGTAAKTASDRELPQRPTEALFVLRLRLRNLSVFRPTERGGKPRGGAVFAAADGPLVHTRALTEIAEEAGHVELHRVEGLEPRAFARGDGLNDQVRVGV